MITLAFSPARTCDRCATGEPVTAYAARQLRGEDAAGAPHTARKLQRWKENQKWKTVEKWQGNEKWKGDDDTEPKWKGNDDTEPKWKGNDDNEPKWKTTSKYTTNV